MRLIDADSLLKSISTMSDLKMNGVTIAVAVAKCVTIDAVPVVRCQDCIRRYDTDECPMCYLSEGKYYEYTNGNGFCDRGKRKEGADNG